MNTDVMFYLNSVAFGVGLAMDAFSVSMANGLHETKMKKSKMLSVAGVFAAFQIMMPMIGWICVRTAASMFSAFGRAIPWISLILLLFIGGKMIAEALFGKESEEGGAVGAAGLILQGIATSIDALSVGFTISDYSLRDALTESLIIGAVTFGICVAGVMIGKKFGTKLGARASVLGGVILILIGIEIFVGGLIG